jgi:transcriptional regulator with XRE-family HTH domain
MPLRTARSGRPEDARAGFFRDLRALRTRRGLKLVDIAERTRFSADALADVESGPELPSLPALEAYLRGCGEPLADWEDRWRQLDLAAAAGATGAGELPVREAGTSALAAAGASAGQAAAAFGVAYPLGRPGRRKRPPGASRQRLPALVYTAAAGVTVLLATGGLALLAWSHGAGGHRGPAITAPRSPGAPAPGTSSTGRQPGAGGNGPGAGGNGAGGNGPGATPVRSARLHSTTVVPHPQAATAAPGTAAAQPGAAAAQAQAAAPLTEVAGIGCPQGNVVVANAPTGPGWTPSDGGWTGDGCDGSAVWTMDPNGNQPVPSTLTWEFGLTAGVSHCTLAVFVPTRKALGVGQYAVFADAGTTVADIASVAINQAAAAGQWVTLGSYPVQGTSLEIQVAPAASTAGTPGPGAHGHKHDTSKGADQNSAIAASAARAACA